MQILAIKPHPEDVILWCDGTWCERSELEQMSHMSDDFTVIPAHTGDWDVFMVEQGN